MQQGQSQPLFSGAQWWEQRQWTQPETQEIPSEHQETERCDRSLPQIGHDSCGASSLSNTQELFGCCHLTHNSYHLFKSLDLFTTWDTETKYNFHKDFKMF